MTDHEELRQLEGVGPVKAAALAAAGYTSLARLAAARPDELTEALASLKPPVPIPADRVIAQATALVGDEDDQATLPSGNRFSGPAQLLVQELGASLLKAPAFRSVMLKRIVSQASTRAYIARKVVKSLG